MEGIGSLDLLSPRVGLGFVPAGGVSARKERADSERGSSLGISGKLGDRRSSE